MNYIDQWAYDEPDEDGRAETTIMSVRQAVDWMRAVYGELYEFHSDEEVFDEWQAMHLAYPYSIGGKTNDTRTTS